LENVYGNTHQGIHAASLGGTWQIAVTGFGGLRLKDDLLSINPKLPPEWEELRFRIWFRQALIELRTTGDTTEVFLVSDKGRMAREIQLEIYGRVYALTQRRSVTATTSGNR
jgi:trehalose/maltose hydrolase-like predicted phosphorylase